MIQKPAPENDVPLEQAMLDGLRQVAGGLAGLQRQQGLAEICANLAHLSKIYPKGRTVIFVGRGYFGDNTKYAYLAVCDAARGMDVKPYFYTEDAAQHALLTDAGLPCLPPVAANWGAEETRAVLSTKLLVLSDPFFARHYRNPVPHALMQGAKTIQLWHGIPIKGIGLEHIPSNLAAGNASAAEILAACGPSDVFVGTAAAQRKDWRRRFAFVDYAALGCVRDDVLFRDVSGFDLLNADRAAYDAAVAARATGMPVILYAPTFREGGALQWFHDGGIDKLAVHCRTKRYFLCVNLHPADHGSLDEMTGAYPNIRFLAPQSDIFPVLKNADLLVTDYSSLLFDFLMLDRPLVIYRPDQASYANETRGLGSAAQVTPGEMALTPAELLQAVDMAIADKNNFRAARQTARKDHFDHIDGRAGERLCELILRELGKDRD